VKTIARNTPEIKALCFERNSVSSSVKSHSELRHTKTNAKNPVLTNFSDRLGKYTFLSLKTCINPQIENNIAMAAVDA
jgi:hypothetical protein